MSSFILCACGGSGSAPLIVPDPTLSSIQENVFNTSCTQASCHDSNLPGGNLDLTAGAAYSSLLDGTTDNEAALALGKKRVIAGDPDNSFLIQKLEGPDEDEGDLMPQSNEHLPDEVIAAIRNWITDGARDN